MKKTKALLIACAGLLATTLLTPVAHGSAIVSAVNPNSILPTFVATKNLTINGTSGPDDLVEVTKTVKKSLVAVICGENLASGWVANVAPSQKMISAGLNSYVITDYVGIEDCVAKGVVTVQDLSGNKYEGVVWAQNADQGLVALAVPATLPGLPWHTEPPQPGIWIGFLQALPKNGTFLTTAVLVSYDFEKNTGATVAPLIPVRSGGPVFDREGHALGTATVYATGDSPAVKINGSMTSCGALVQCVSFTDTNTYKAATLLVTGVQKTIDNIRKQSAKLLVTYKKTPAKVRAIKNILKALPSKPDLKAATDPVTAALAYSNQVQLIHRIFDTQFPGYLT